MITNIKISLAEKVEGQFFTSGVARLTNAREDQTFLSETYSAHYLESISNIQRKADVTWKGNIEEEVEFSFTVIDMEHFIKNRIYHLGNFQGAKVDVYTSGQQHVFYVETVEGNDSLATFHCRNQKYLSNNIQFIANTSMEVSPSPNSFQPIFTTIKTSAIQTPCVIHEIGDNRIPSTRAHYSAQLIKTSRATENYITLKTKPSDEHSAYLTKDVRISFSTNDNIVGGVLSTITNLSGWSYLKVIDIGQQLRLVDETSLPDIDGLSMAQLETNLAIYQLPNNAKPPFSLTFGGGALFIADENDSRYNAINQTVTLPVDYVSDTYSYIDPEILPQIGTSGFHTSAGLRFRYHPEFETYKVYTEAEEFWSWYTMDWTANSAVYGPYESSAINQSKLMEAIQNPAKAVTIYDYTYGGTDWKVCEFQIPFTDELKAIAEGSDKWGVGLNIFGGRELGNPGGNGEGDGGQFGVKVIPWSDTLGVYVETISGTKPEPFLFDSNTPGNIWSRDIDEYFPVLDTPPGFPPNMSWNPEGSYWVDLKPEEYYLCDRLKVQLFLKINPVYMDQKPYIDLYWFGLIVKNKPSEIEDADAILTTYNKADLAKAIYGTYGVSAINDGLEITYATPNDGEMEKLILSDYALASRTLIREEGSQFRQIPLTMYSSAATPISNIINCSELIQCDSSEFCNAPKVTWYNGDKRREETIFFDFTLSAYDKESSVKFSNKLSATYDLTKLSATWNLCKYSQNLYKATANQDVYIFGGTIGEVVDRLYDAMEYATLRRDLFSITVPFTGLNIGDRVSVYHPRLSFTNTFYGIVKALSVNALTGETEIQVLSDISITTHDADLTDEELDGMEMIFAQ